MSHKNHYIGINQRIPIQVLDNALMYILRGELLFQEEVLRDLSEHIGGQNRLKKALQIVNRIILSTEAAKLVAQHFSFEEYTHLPDSDKKALITALIANAYPFAYHLMSIMGTVLKVQPFVNAQYINEKMSEKYGSNRATDIANYSLIPMFLELGFINRKQVSLYEKCESHPINNQKINEFLIFTEIKNSGSKSFTDNHLSLNPWFYFFKPKFNTPRTLSILSYTESGYSNNGIYAIAE